MLKQLFVKGEIPPVDLYLISEKSIWKNQVRQTGFLPPVDLYLIFEKSSCKNQDPSKIDFEIDFCRLQRQLKSSSK